MKHRRITTKFLDLKPLPKPSQLDAPDFPIDFLPEPWRTYIADIAERIGVSPDIPAVAAIAQAASFLGDGVRLRMKSRDEQWTTRAITWTAIVAPPASHKTPAIDQIMSITAAIESERREEYQERMADYNDRLTIALEREKAWKDQIRKGNAPSSSPRPPDAEIPEKPTLARLVVNDVTQEQFVTLLNESDGHLTLHSDELAGVIKRFNQYRSGGDREFYLAIHAGSSYVYDRKSSEPIALTRPYANILGGIQPEKLTVFMMDGAGDGLQARFSILIWPSQDAEYEYVDREHDAKAQHQVETRLRKLLAITKSGPVTLRFSPKAQNRFKSWYTSHRKRLPTLEPTLQAHFGKYDGLFGALCLVHHFMSGKDPDTLVKLATASSVARFIKDYLEPHARKVYGYATETTAISGADRISRHIQDNRRLRQFTRRDIKQMHWSGLTEDASVERALDILIAHGWIRKVSKAATGGRPTDRYLINPKVHSLE